MKKICIMMVGLPGVGKSTLINELQSKIHGLKIISTDKYVEEVAKKSSITYNQAFSDEVFKKAQKNLNLELSEILKKGEAFVWDQTNVVKSARIKKISNLLKQGYDCVAVVFDLPKEIHQKRILKRKEETGKFINEKIMKNLEDSFELPDLGEGFGIVYIIDNEQNTPKVLAKRNEFKLDVFRI